MFFPHVMKIGFSDSVLEIGPGAYPFWRSDCLADIFDENSVVDLAQFGGNALNTKGKPLFQIVNGKLPFKNKSFDYVICSHVFEHVPVSDLSLLASEILRVGKKAYIEFPRPLYDYAYNFSVHLNLLDIADGTIICIDKTKTQLAAAKNFSKYGKIMREKNLFVLDNYFQGLLAVGSEFADSIPLRIVEDENEFWEIVTKNEYRLQPPSFAWLVKNKIHPKRIGKSIFGEQSKETFSAKLEHSK